jgi:hypothetical protein
MTAYTIGENCQITLQHPSVNSGEPYGFLITGPDKDFGPAVTVQHEVDSDGTVTIRVYFSVLLADDLANPDSTNHTDNRAVMYATLLQFLSLVEGITLVTSNAIFANIGAVGHSATETHYESVSVVTCQLNNSGPYYPVPDPTAFNASAWDGILTWSTSYWR